MLTRKMIIGMTIAVVVLMNAMCWGTTYYVDPVGDNDANGLSWENAFATIGHGIYTATSGDIVEVNEGTYYENISFNGKDITIRSKDPNNWSIVEATVIDGYNLGSVVTFNNGETSDSVLEGFTITDGNSNNYGGGIDVNEASPTIRNCIIRDNYAGPSGGGMYNYGGNPTISRCIFRNNESYNDGAGIFNSSGGITVTNSMFVKNDAGYSGGALFHSSGDANIINCTFSGNTSMSSGSAIYASSYMELTNCILWGDTMNGVPNEIYDGGSIAVTYSDVEGGFSGAGNINSDPRFIDPNSYDYHLALNSPCIDVGDSNGTYSGQVDIDGNDRVIDSLGKGDGIVDIDMGADETLSGQWWYVKPDGNDAADGNSWDSAFATISHAINQASDYEVIHVAVGTYYETIDFNGVSCTITSTDPIDWDVIAKTIIDGDHPSLYVVTFENSEDANSVLKGFTITGRRGIHCDEASPTISNCVITGNGLGTYGVGMYNIDSSPTVTNCVFSENKAEQGGGIFDSNSSPTLISCVFADNFADANGGAMYNYNSCPILINCAFSGNDANGDGGGMYNCGASDPNLTNCIFWGNAADGSGDEICNDANSDPNFRFCDIQGSGGSGSWDPNFGSDDGNNIDSDPYFTDASDPIGPDDMFGTIDDGLRLQMVSPCIDAADGDVSPAADISGSGRIDIDYVSNIGTGDPNYADIGAYESPTIWFVDIDATGNNDGTSWEDAFPDLKDALAGASDGDEVWVAEGTYKPDDVNDDRSVSFELANGASVYGGFAGTEGGHHERDWITYKAILSGDIGTPSDQNDNSYHVVKGASNALLDGFRVTGGNADGSYPDNVGGGMYNSPASTVMNCFFSDNVAAAAGGMWNTDGASIINCVFSGNSSSGYGGGMYNIGSGVEITSCTFSGNEATVDGGAMGSSSYSPTVTNCIFWGDTSDEIYNFNSSPTFSYCDIQGCGGSSSWDPNFGTDGGGNIDSDPCFADANTPAGADGILGTLDDGLRLMADSPCVDAADGDAAFWADSLGLARIDEDANNTGTGSPDYVDIGAYECGNDSDGDGMPDEWEIRYGLNPANSGDAGSDADSDGLSNLNEYLAGTDPTDSDSDDDGMPDGWEVDNGLDPLVDDASDDNDIDGLTNLSEYNNNTDPYDADTDDDYMLDGWEVDNGLEPDDATGNNGSNGNLDGDAYVNLCEYLHGSDPNNDSNTPQSTTTITVPTEVGSIQSAIDLCIEGDVVEAMPGTYYETLSFTSKAITLTSIDPNDWWLVEKTMIDAGGASAGVATFGSGDANSTITGLTLTNGQYGVSCGSSSCNPVITRCIIEDNTSHGIYCTAGSPEITNNMIGDNTGDGIRSSSSTPPTIKNNWIYDNSDGIEFSSALSAATVRNNTIVYNDSNGIRVDSNTAPTVSNCILWGNNGDLYDCNATYSCIEDGADPNYYNISSDPLFIDASSDDYRLQRTSPCINTGDPNQTYTGETDIEGEVREAKTVDMGADEVCEVHNNTQDTWYSGVDSQGIQDAIDDANEGDVIVVYEWTFYESIDFNDVNIMLTSTDPCNWDVVEATIIDANDSDANVVTFDSGQDANSILKGFTITGGKNGVYCDNSSSPIIRNCIITDNNSAGIACISGSPLIINNKISENGGDGIYSSSTIPPAIKYNWIYANNNGIKLTDANSAAWILNNTIIDNNSIGIYRASGTDPNINSCILWGNDGNDLVDCNNVRYSCVEEGADPNYYNFAINPSFSFADGDSNDFHLSPISPCEDFGDPNVDRSGDKDIDGHSVEQDNPPIGGDEPFDLYVNASSDYTGGNTYKFLQSALWSIRYDPARTASRYRIFVAGGTYYPDLWVEWEKPGPPYRYNNTNDPGATFELITDVEIYGGFPPKVPTNQWTWYHRLPEVHKTILSGQIDTDKNSYHVVTGASHAVLDGFKIEKGNANGNGFGEGNGGGMYNMYDNSPTVRNCIFEDNSSGGSGAGMYNYDSSPTVENCDFLNNTAQSGGGGMDNFAWSHPVVTNCVFSNNAAGSIGGGGGIANFGYCDPTITNCVFYNNSAYSGGGISNGFHCFGANPIINCTFYKNSASEYGGAMINSSNCSPTVVNCILWDDEPDEITNFTGSDPALTYCDVKGGYPGTGNINADPMFLDDSNPDPAGYDGIWRTYDDGLKLDPGSPCVDKGDEFLAPEKDITGMVRNLPDMGAYECRGVHFTDGFIGDNREGEYGWWYSKAFYDDEGSDILAPGSYNTDTALIETLAVGPMKEGTFDSFIVPTGLRITITWPEDPDGDPVTGQKRWKGGTCYVNGPIVIYNEVYHDWAKQPGDLYWDAVHKKRDDWEPPALQAEFPQSVRLWSKEVMGENQQYYMTAPVTANSQKYVTCWAHGSITIERVP